MNEQKKHTCIGIIVILFFVGWIGAIFNRNSTDDSSNSSSYSKSYSTDTDIPSTSDSTSITTSKTQKIEKCIDTWLQEMPKSNYFEANSFCTGYYNAEE